MPAGEGARRVALSGAGGVMLVRKHTELGDFATLGQASGRAGPPAGGRVRLGRVVGVEVGLGVDPVEPGRGVGRGAGREGGGRGGQVEVGEDRGDDVGVGDRGDDLDRAGAAGADLEVLAEHASGCMPTERSARQIGRAHVWTPVTL